jgi:hypothetical protein
MIEDVFTKPPAHGRISNWLGPKMVRGLLDFAQTHRDDFGASRVTQTDECAGKVDLAIRQSSRVTL